MINSDDLADALEQGEIFGAGLDVITGEPNIGPDHRLVKAKNCTCTCIPEESRLMTGVVIPHMGSADIDTRKKMAELCKLPLRLLHATQLTSGVRNGINGAKGEALLAEVKP